MHYCQMQHVTSAELMHNDLHRMCMSDDSLVASCRRRRAHSAERVSRDANVVQVYGDAAATDGQSVLLVVELMQVRACGMYLLHLQSDICHFCFCRHSQNLSGAAPAALDNEPTVKILSRK